MTFDRRGPWRASPCPSWAVPSSIRTDNTKHTLCQGGQVEGSRLRPEGSQRRAQKEAPAGVLGPGRAAASTCSPRLRQGKHWLPSGHYTQTLAALRPLHAYCFAIKARLNLLPVKTMLHHAGKCNNNTTLRPRCRSQPESPGHVLNACTQNTGLMRASHNTILQHLVKAIPKEDKPVRGACLSPRQ